jgi:PTS system mannose-specific IIA component
MMVAIVVGTHGNFSRELIRTCEMILGPKDNVAAVTLEPGESADGLVEKYKSAVKGLDSSGGILFITDLFGGSPYNAACKIAIEKDNVGVVAGVNLSMALEVLNLQDLPVEQIVEIAQAAGKQGIMAFNKSDIINNEEEDL